MHDVLSCVLHPRGERPTLLKGTLLRTSARIALAAAATTAEPPLLLVEFDAGGSNNSNRNNTNSDLRRQPRKPSLILVARDVERKAN
mmetsp:Transcript_39730/g.84936  ORF Transcript_39730/g.84936 Transcript_39730/m.84936 type:complete len:87 (+) Transcript_39730:1382-1642(+)